MAEFEGGIGPPCVRRIEVDEVGEEMDSLPGGAGAGAGEGGGGDGLLPHPVIISHCTHAFFNKLHTQPMLQPMPIILKRSKQITGLL